MSGSGRVGAQPYQIENECSVGSSTTARAGSGASSRGPGVGPRAVDAVAVVLGVLRRPAPRSPPRSSSTPRSWAIARSAIGHAAERRQHALGLLGGLAHRGRVQQQHRRALGPRQARGGDHRLDDASSDGSSSSIQVSSGSSSDELEHPRVVGHRRGQWERAQVKAGDRRRRSPGPRPARPTADRRSRSRRRGPARRRR